MNGALRASVANSKHDNFSDIAAYLSKEYQCPALRGLMLAADHRGHINFYENRVGQRALQDTLHAAQTAVRSLEGMYGTLRRGPSQSTMRTTR